MCFARRRGRRGSDVDIGDVADISMSWKQRKRRHIEVLEYKFDIVVRVFRSRMRLGSRIISSEEEYVPRNRDVLHDAQDSWEIRIE